MNKVTPQDLDPYPGEFLREDLEDRFFCSNQMLAFDYIGKEDRPGALECMNNIYLAHKKTASQ